MISSSIIKATTALHLELCDQAVDNLALYLSELLKWNQRVNLTAVTDPQEAVEKHIVDSLYLGKLIPEYSKLLDMGSGAGLPGVVLAIVRPDIEVISVDSVGKKINFQRHVKRQLDLENVMPINCRVEDLVGLDLINDITTVTARAFTSLLQLAEYAAPLMKDNCLLLAMKGPEGERELQSELDLVVRKGFNLLHVESYKLPLSLAERKIIKLVKNTDY